MARFQPQKQSHIPFGRAVSIAVFLLVLGIFYNGIHSMSDSTRRRQRESLEHALSYSITWCYSVEGTYPESLEYLKEHYGLTYDENHFYVDYQTIGSNIRPDVTIIQKGE